MKQQIRVFLMGGGAYDSIGVAGEVMFDASEDSLVVRAEDGTYVNFNWAHVLFYTITDADQGGPYFD